MLANIPRDTNSFLTSLTRDIKISPQPQECGAELVTVTNEPVPRSSSTLFAFSQSKHFFLN